MIFFLPTKIALFQNQDKQPIFQKIWHNLQSICWTYSPKFECFEKTTNTNFFCIIKHIGEEEKEEVDMNFMKDRDTGLWCSSKQCYSLCSLSGRSYHPSKVGHHAEQKNWGFYFQQIKRICFDLKVVKREVLVNTSFCHNIYFTTSKFKDNKIINSDCTVKLLR